MGCDVKERNIYTCILYYILTNNNKKKNNVMHLYAYRQIFNNGLPGYSIHVFI